MRLYPVALVVVFLLVFIDECFFNPSLTIEEKIIEVAASKFNEVDLQHNPSARDSARYTVVRDFSADHEWIIRNDTVCAKVLSTQTLEFIEFEEIFRINFKELPELVSRATTNTFVVMDKEYATLIVVVSGTEYIWSFDIERNDKGTKVSQRDGPTAYGAVHTLLQELLRILES